MSTQPAASALPTSKSTTMLPRKSLSIAGLDVCPKAFALVGTVVDVIKERQDKGEGCIPGFELWSDVSKKMPLYAWIVDPQRANPSDEVSQDTMDAMKGLATFVCTLTDSMKEALLAARGASKISSEFKSDACLMSLPNEILSIIIELAALENEPGFGALELSHVCRRFRSISLDLPKIWTRVSYEYHDLEIARLYAQRSKHAGLEVTLDDCDHTRYCSRILQAVIPFCNEWRSFSYTVYYPDRHSWHVSEQRIPLKLPRLEHLQVELDNEGIYKLHDMPNLRSAHFITTIPSPSFLSTITSFSMTFKSLDEDFGGADLEDLVEFLINTPSIRDLSFTVRDRFHAFDPMGNPEWDRSLPNIQTFTLDVVYKDKEAEDEDSEALQDFTHSLEMPNLSHMKLSVRFTLYTSSTTRKDPFVFGFLPHPKTHTKLTSLDLTIIHERGQYSHDKDPESFTYGKFDDILLLEVEDAPFLSTLKLKTNFELYLLLEDNKPFFPLRSLELDHCPRLRNEFLADVYRGLNHDGNWECFEKAIVRGCPKIKTDTGFLRSVTREKVRYEPVSQNEKDPLGYRCYDLW